MQATITYLLSEQAQRAQMAATGQPVARKQTVIEELPADLLDCRWVTIAEDGSISADLTQSYQFDRSGTVHGSSSWNGVPVALSVFPTSGVAVIRERIATVAAESSRLRLTAQQEKEEDERKDAEYVAAAQPAIETFLAGDQPAWGRDSGVAYWVILESPDGDRIRIDRERFGMPLVAKLAAHHEANKARIQAEKAAAEEAKEQAKQDYIAAFMAREDIDPLIAAQYRAGLLARNDAISIIADMSLAQLPPAAPDWDVCDDYAHNCSVKNITALPYLAFRAWQQIAATLPQGTTWIFRRIIPCLRDEGDSGDEGDEGVGEEMITAVITVPVGPFSFVREVRLA